MSDQCTFLEQLGSDMIVKPVRDSSVSANKKAMASQNGNIHTLSIILNLLGRNQKIG